MKKNILAFAGFGILSLSLIGGSFAYSASKTDHLNKKLMKTMNQQKKSLDQLTNTLDEMKKKEEKENNTIAGTYPVIDFTYLADAYKSGKTKDLSEEDKETLELAQEFLKDIITDDMTPYDKELAIHDKLCTYASKDLTNSVSAIPDEDIQLATPHGVLKYKKAVCIGYATTFRLLLNMVDIPCQIVKSSDLGHSWDLVQLDDNAWYHVDCYSDSSDTNQADHNYFNMNNEQCLSNNDFQVDDYPKAEGSKYNYISLNTKELDSIYDLPEYLKENLTQSTTLYVHFKESIPFEYVDAILNALLASEEYSGGELYESTQMYNEDDFTYVIYYKTAQDVAAIDEINDDEQVPYEDVDFDKLCDKFSEIFGSEVNLEDYYYTEEEYEEAYDENNYKTEAVG